MTEQQELDELRGLYEQLDRWLEEAARTRKVKAMTILENRLERSFAALFRAQASDMRRALEHERSRRARRAKAPQEAGGTDEPDWQEPWRRTVQLTSQGMARALELTMREAMRQGIGAANAELGGSIHLENPRAVAWVSQHAAEAVTGINDTTRAELQQIIQAGVETGTSYDSIARQIVGRLEQYATGDASAKIRSRAHLIAVTEVGTAYVQGNVMVGEQLTDAGLELEKAWLTAEDEGVCPECDGNAGEEYIPFGESFSDGNDEPPGHPGCRCDLLQRVVGSASELDGE